MLFRCASLHRRAGDKVPSMCTWSSTFGSSLMKGEISRSFMFEVHRGILSRHSIYDRLAKSAS